MSQDHLILRPLMTSAKTLFPGSRFRRGHPSGHCWTLCVLPRTTAFLPTSGAPPPPGSPVPTERWAGSPPSPQPSPSPAGHPLCPPSACLGSDPRQPSREGRRNLPPAHAGPAPWAPSLPLRGRATLRVKEPEQEGCRTHPSVGSAQRKPLLGYAVGRAPGSEFSPEFSTRHARLHTPTSMGNAVNGALSI